MSYQGDQIGARVFRSTAQSIPDNTPVFVSFDTEVYDYGDLFDINSPTKLTIRYAGLYDIFACVEFASRADVGGRVLTVVRSGALSIVCDQRPNVAGSSACISGSTSFDLAVGDTLELQVSQTNSGGAAVDLLAVPDRAPVLAVVRIPYLR
jgi:hypothetical protein